MGLLPPRRGAIRFEGQPIERLPSYRIAQRGIGLVPEGRQIFPNLTVRENLVATMMSRMAGGRHWNLDAVLALFPALRERLTSYGGVLSGGEQQMLAIGRALMTNPRLLILDEATEGLAPRIRTEIWRALETLKQEGLSIFIIDKNVQALIRIASRHYVLEKGRIVWSGSSAELAHDVALQHRYLGVQ
jgi:branched-chain amino acid transport system ATP-binding protein